MSLFGEWANLLSVQVWIYRCAELGGLYRLLIQHIFQSRVLDDTYRMFLFFFYPTTVDNVGLILKIDLEHRNSDSRM